MRAVICDTSPLQYLHQSDLLHLLPALFGSAQVPSAVVAELAEGRRRGVRLPEMADIPWVTERPVSEHKRLPLVTSLGNGEKEVLALGLETPNHLLVLDDRHARRYAIAVGLEITGTLGILDNHLDRPTRSSHTASSRGRLVGYGGGLDRKERLLAHERGEPVF